MHAPASPFARVLVASGLLASALLAGAARPPSARAQDMNLALSRLRIPTADGTPPADRCRGGDPASLQFYCDQDAWRRLMTQLGGSLIPPVLTPAGTRGVRGIYVGFESWITPIDNDPDSPVGAAWFRGVEGDGMGASDARSRFVDDVLAWGRFNVRKGLPFGFDLGMNIGYLANTSYWTLGLEVRWALFEGFREDVGWIPDLAVRGAVQTMLGDDEFNLTVPSVDVILSEPFVVGDTVEITPSVYGQVAWIFADSELVDLSPGTPVVAECDPDPATPDTLTGAPPYCRGSGAELNQNVVFDDLRSTRFRLGAGLQIRYEWFQLSGSFLFDALSPSEMDGELPEGLPRQMQIDLAAGVAL